MLRRVYPAFGPLSNAGAGRQPLSLRATLARLGGSHLFTALALGSGRGASATGRVGGRGRPDGGCFRVL
jgi:hypothetical protein